MNRSFSILAGVLGTVIVSFLGLVVIPDWQLAPMEPVTLADGSTRPIEPTGTVAEGRRVYSELGCIYCHTQQVRPAGFGTDHQRGWGQRQTAPVDHIFDRPPMLGTMRSGPDLANIGVRQPSRSWHHLHLYNPVITSPGSNMPPHPFLYDRVPQGEGPRPATALDFPAGWEDERYWWVPSERAEALVDYLLSLDHSYPISREE